MTTAPAARLPLALTQGDPAGIGPEITLKAWLARHAREIQPFYVLTDPRHLQRMATALGLDVPVIETNPSQAASLFADALPVVPLLEEVSASPGHPTAAWAPSTIVSIERAVHDVRASDAAAVVTNPIAKHVLYEAGFAHPGHTEFLAHLAAENGRAPRPVMMLWCEDLAVVPVTIHVPLKAVPDLLTTELIVETGRIVAHDLALRFGVGHPRLAIAGLNPHAGEGGALGMEDDAIIRPAIERLKADGLAVSGPHPADTMFHRAARTTYDAALAMYHDQALIPIKTLAFDEAVNVTLGLSFVRTSPDHGTAFDIAGRGIARPDSLIAALKLAARLAAAEASGPTIA